MLSDQKAAEKMFESSSFELKAAVNVKLFNSVCTPQSKANAT